MLARRQFAALVGVTFSTIDGMGYRGHVPTPGREPYDALLYEVSYDLVRDCRFDRRLAAQIIRQGERSLRAAIGDLDDAPDRAAFFIVAWGEPKGMNCWAAAAPLADILARPPVGPHYRYTIVDIARAAKRIRERAAKLDISIAGFSPMRERCRAGADTPSKQRVDA